MACEDEIRNYLDKPGGQISRDFWECLRKILVRAMRRRGTLGRSPAALGYRGKSWFQPDVLDYLVNDFFVYAFIDRRKSLASRDSQIPPHARVVALAKQFITDKERAHNPVAYYVFKNVQIAVDALVASQVLAKRPASKVRNSTRIAPLGQLDGRLLDCYQLRDHIAAMEWDRKALSRLTTKNRQGPTLIKQLLCRLNGPCIVSDLVHKLMDALDPFSRRQLPIRPQRRDDDDRQDGPTDPDAIAPIEPDRTVDHDEYLHNLDAQIRQRIQQTRGLQKGTKERLLLIWHTLWTSYQQTGSWMSQSELAQRLEIDRRRISEDFNRLQDIVRQIDPDIRW